MKKWGQRRFGANRAQGSRKSRPGSGLELDRDVVAVDGDGYDAVEWQHPVDLGPDCMGDGGLLGLLAGVWRWRGAASRTDGTWSFMVATTIGWMRYTEAAEMLLCPGPRSTGRQPIPAPCAAGRGQQSMMRK